MIFRLDIKRAFAFCMDVMPMRMANSIPTESRLSSEMETSNSMSVIPAFWRRVIWPQVLGWLPLAGPALHPAPAGGIGVGALNGTVVRLTTDWIELPGEDEPAR